MILKYSHNIFKCSLNICLNFLDFKKKSVLVKEIRELSIFSSKSYNSLGKILLSLRKYSSLHNLLSLVNF